MKAASVLSLGILVYNVAISVYNVESLHKIFISFFSNKVVVHKYLRI